MSTSNHPEQFLSADWILPLASDPISEGGIVLQAGKILAFGKAETLRRSFPGLSRQHFPGAVLMPGLVNAHTHLDLSLLRDRLTLPNDFVSWILELIPLRLRMDERQTGEALRQGVQETIQSGTTTIGDITRSGNTIPLLQDARCRGVLFREVIGRSLHEEPSWIQDLKEEIGSLQDAAGDRITIGLSPHTPYTLSKERMETLAAYLKDSPLPCAMHIAESKAEQDYFLHHEGELKSRFFPAIGWGKMPDPEEFGTPLEQVRRNGLLSRRLAVVHGVHLSTEDIERLQKTGSSVILCPRSNHFLQVGTVPIGKLLEAGIPLALGTDSLASNRSLSLWDEMRFIRVLFPGNELVTPETLLRMATLGGAGALGLSRRIGSIEAGKAADLIAVECRVKKTEDLAVTLIEKTAPEQIRMVMVEGERIL